MSVLILIHVLFGTLAVSCGFVAISCRKGSQVHRTAGRFFTLSMLIMALVGGGYAIFIDQPINVLASCLTCYLVITGWHAARFKLVRRSTFCNLAFGFILLVAIKGYILSYSAMHTEDGMLGGYSYVAYLFLATVAMFAALLDGYLTFKGQLTANQRLVRHIWRITFSFFITAGSLFTGPGAKAFPQFIQTSGVLDIPEPFILLMLLYWVIKTKYNARKTNMS